MMDYSREEGMVSMTKRTRVAHCARVLVGVRDAARSLILAENFIDQGFTEAE